MAKKKEIITMIEQTEREKIENWFYNNLGLHVVNYGLTYDFQCYVCDRDGKKAVFHVKDPLEAIKHATTHKEFKNRWLELEKDMPKTVPEALRQKRAKKK